MVVVVYAAEVTGGELKACDECLEVQAFPPESIPWDDLAFDSTRAALKDYVRRFFPRVRRGALTAWRTTTGSTGPAPSSCRGAATRRWPPSRRSSPRTPTTSAPCC